MLVCRAACEAMEAGLFGTFWGRRPLLPQLQCALLVSRPAWPACVWRLIRGDCNMASLRTWGFRDFGNCYKDLMITQALFLEGTGCQVFCRMCLPGNGQAYIRQHRAKSAYQLIICIPVWQGGDQHSTIMGRCSDLVMMNGRKTLLRAYCYAQKNSDN